MGAVQVAAQSFSSRDYRPTSQSAGLGSIQFAFTKLNSIGIHLALFGLERNFEASSYFMSYKAANGTSSTMNERQPG